MPPPPHTRVTFSGIFGDIVAPTEIWAFGFSLSSVTLDRETLALLALDLRGAYSSALVNTVANNVRLTNVRCASIGLNGRVDRDGSGAYIQADELATVAGTGGTAYLPLQVSQVVTLETPFSGSTGRGRFYLPGPACGTLGADGRISGTVQTSHTNAAKAFLDACNVAAATSNMGRVCVASGGSVTKGLAPALHEVTSVRVGRVLDTMRSRRGDLEEEKITSALAA